MNKYSYVLCDGKVYTRKYNADFLDNYGKIVTLKWIDLYFWDEERQFIDRVLTHESACVFITEEQKYDYPEHFI